MLTKVTAYSQWSTIDPLVLNVINRPETDQFEVRNIDGLGAVKADVNTTPLGSVKGSDFVGTNVDYRNILLTLGLDPDWDEWTVSRLRRHLDLYFMPEQSIRLVFETQEFSPVEISGYIESNEPNMFSKDPEHAISIICPKPDFRSVDAIVVEGNTDEDPYDITYNGNIETGVNLSINHLSGGSAGIVTVETGDQSFIVDPAEVSAAKYFEVNSLPGDKYVRNYTIPDEVITSLLNAVQVGSKWPTLRPGIQEVDVNLDAGIADWTLTYHELFGSL